MNSAISFIRTIPLNSGKRSNRSFLIIKGGKNGLSDAAIPWMDWGKNILTPI
jgi:hypothetical protein